MTKVEPVLREPLRVPRLVAVSDHLLVYEAIAWKLRTKPWFLPENAAASLGHFFATASSDVTEPSGMSHGDFAPWNLLLANDGLVLVDWEEAGIRPPFYDLFHFLVQSIALLGRPRLRDLIGGLFGEGHVGRLIQAYSEASGVPIESARTHLRGYLETSIADVAEDRKDHVKGRRARGQVLEALDRTP